MHNNKTYSLLQALTPIELEHMDTFLQSPWFNKRDTTLDLFRYLKMYYPSFTHNAVSKEAIFTRFFPGEDYDDKKVRYILSDLNKCIEEYFIQLSLRKNPLSAHHILRRMFFERGFQAEFIQEAKESEDLLEESPYRNSDYFLNMYHVQNDVLSYKNSYESRKEKSNIEQLMQSLDQFYLAKKLQLSCEIYNLQNVLSVEYSIFLDEIIQHVENTQNSRTPVVEIYYKILMTLHDSENEAHFKTLQVILKKHALLFPVTELNDIYRSVINYCIKKINTGDITYQTILFETYQYTLEKNILTPGDKLSQWEYKNVVTISLREKQYEWCYNFITQYKKYLHPDERENAYSYNMALWHFYNKEYTKTLQLLQQVQFTDVYYQLDSRVVLLKAYFELGEWEPFQYQVSAFRMYLRRNRVASAYQRTIYNNFLKYISQLSRSRGNKSKLKAILQEIEDVKQIADIRWLKDKALEAV